MHPKQAYVESKKHSIIVKICPKDRWLPSLIVVIGTPGGFLKSTRTVQLLKKFAGHDFIIDDESYLTLSHTTLSGNNRFYSSNLHKTPNSIKNRYVTKFEPKILVYLAISPRGMSRPIFFRTGLAVNQNVYREKCLKLSLIPFIRDKYRHRPYVFWPDLASSHLQAASRITC